MEKRECFCLQLSFPPKYGDRGHFLSCLYVLTHLIINGLGRQLALLQRFPGSVGPFPLSTKSCSTLPSYKKKSASRRPPPPLGLPVTAVTWPAAPTGWSSPDTLLHPSPGGRLKCLQWPLGMPSGPSCQSSRSCAPATTPPHTLGDPTPLSRFPPTAQARLALAGSLFCPPRKRSLSEPRFQPLIFLFFFLCSPGTHGAHSAQTLLPSTRQPPPYETLPSCMSS